ncbi:MAG: orotidine-5'-phosphate decarboxylase [Candidatus Pacebacteria bacterium]|nr:orotidine-5'-phosphate decarboxylase [Candidatus Paceibacterota bacterium]
MRNFNELLRNNWNEGKYLCVGLDPEYEKIPESLRKSSVRETIVAFNRAIIDATKTIACGYKPNTAFYEAHGDEGFAALQETCFYILEHAPEVALILDAKRADIGNTNLGYVSFAFEQLRADAITLHPYLGAEALQPFLDRKDKGIFILCRTSNPGAGELQHLSVGEEPLYLHVAKRVASAWNGNGNCGLVVGATYPTEIAAVRKVAPGVPFLIPGIGAQGGDLRAAVAAAKEQEGAFLICASRSIMYASRGLDFAEAAQKAALELDTAIRTAV